jgi:DNA gyrase subunit A
MHINNLLELSEGDELACTLTIKSLDVDGYFIMATKNGLIKKTEIREYNINLRKKGTKAINIVESDELKFIATTDGNSDIMLITTNGLAARYFEDNVKPCGKNSQGVKAMVLKEGDSLASMIAFDKNLDPSVLVVSSTGTGKRTNASEYRSGSGRNIRGLKTIDTSSNKNGKIVAGLAVSEDDELLILTSKGLIQRSRVSDMKLKGRAGVGIKIITLNDGDTIQSVIKVDKSEEIDYNNEENREVNV